MASRDVLDERIDVWKDAYKDGQNEGRAARTWGDGFGQVLRGNGRPSDQAEDGVLLPANLKNDGWINVYEAPNGFGFEAYFEAEEAGTVYHKFLTSHEGGAFVESEWIQEVLT